jgi:hypothetical protein
MNKLVDTVTVPVAAGLVAAAEAAYMFPGYDRMSVPLLGEVSPAVGFGVHTALAAAVGQVGGNYVLPYLPKLGSYANIEKRIAAPLVTGVADVALVRFTGNDRVSMQQAFLIGASSHLIGQYAVDTIMPMQTRY